MSAEEAEDLVGLAYRMALGREPRARELAHFAALLAEGEIDARGLLTRIERSQEYGVRTSVAPAHPPGHYYSPVVDPSELGRPLVPDRAARIDGLAGLSIRQADLEAWFDGLLAHVGALRFAEGRGGATRYFADNPIFPLGDAVILDAVIGRLRPARIVEIGSGLSTAAMLDAVEHRDLATRVTAVEPYPDRLLSVTSEADRAGPLELLEARVQEVPLSRFEALGAGDILFIDSSHVLKTGSDVCFELFEILPRLARGVHVHFHDIGYPFEYPDGWVFDRRYSWNEVYAVRAFLSFNEAWTVRAYNACPWPGKRAALEARYGAPIANPGGGLWIERTG